MNLQCLFSRTLYLLLLISLQPVFSQGFDNKTRAVYILDISKYIEYPESFSRLDNFTIGILDESDELFWEVENLSRTRKFIQGKPIRMLYFRDLSEIVPTQVIYVNKTSGIRINSILSKIQGNNTLLVSEGYEFRESMLNFVVISDKPEFEVNLDLMNKEGLKVNQLFLAQAIKTREDWQKLFEKTDEELQEEKEITRQQKLQIQEQEAIISEQKEQIQKQEARIDSLDKEIHMKLTEIKKKEGVLRYQMNEISLQNQKITEQAAAVKTQEGQLSKLEVGIKKKEGEILKQSQLIESQNGKIIDQLRQIEKQRIISYFILVALLLVSGLGYFIYINYRNKKKANEILKEKNRLITFQNEEIQKQKELAEMQRDQIAYQKKHITDSIHYALRIQRAILPSLELFSDKIEHFVLYKPRDIVSGDFYWVNHREESWIVIAADCTGHGVPGAFMSMLGISFLNEIVNNRNIRRPDLILNELRENIIQALKQMDSHNTVKDGMDISVCSLDYKQSVLEWAGANNPLLLIQGGELNTVKADKMPVAIHDIMEPFTLHRFVLKKGDTLYIFSDGYNDQFGGPNQKKFLSKNFKDTIMSMQDLSMLDQGKKLDDTFEEWRKDVEQVDDVTVIGIRYQGK